MVITKINANPSPTRWRTNKSNETDSSTNVNPSRLSLSSDVRLSRERSTTTLVGLTNREARRPRSTSSCVLEHYSTALNRADSEPLVYGDGSEDKPIFLRAPLVLQVKAVVKTGLQTTLKIVSFPDEFNGISLMVVLSSSPRTGATSQKIPNRIEFERSATTRVMDNAAKWKFTISNPPAWNPMESQEFTENVQLSIVTELGAEVVRAQDVTVVAQGVNAKRMDLHTRITIDWKSSEVVELYPPGVATSHTNETTNFRQDTNLQTNLHTTNLRPAEQEQSTSSQTPSIQQIRDVVTQLAATQAQVYQLQRTLELHLQSLQPTHSHSSLISTLQAALNNLPTTSSTTSRTSSMTSHTLPHLCVYGANVRVVKLGTLKELRARAYVEFQIPPDQALDFSYKIHGTDISITNQGELENYLTMKDNPVIEITTGAKNVPCIQKDRQERERRAREVKGGRDRGSKRIVQEFFDSPAVNNASNTSGPPNAIIRLSISRRNSDSLNNSPQNTTTVSQQNISSSNNPQLESISTFSTSQQNINSPYPSLRNSKSFSTFQSINSLKSSQLDLNSYNTSHQQDANQLRAQLEDKHQGAQLTNDQKQRDDYSVVHANVDSKSASFEEEPVQPAQVEGDAAHSGLVRDDSQVVLGEDHMQLRLFKAIKRKDNDQVAELIKAPHGDMNTKNQEGLTLLHVACISNNIKAAKMLIRNGANVNSISNNGTTILHTACTNGMYKMTALLIRYGANVNATDKDGLLPLQVCPLKSAGFDLFTLVYLSSDVKNVHEVHLRGVLSQYIGSVVNQTKLNTMLSKTMDSLSNKKTIDMSRKQLTFFLPSEFLNFDKLRTLNLSHNFLTRFPDRVLLAENLSSLDLSHNHMDEVPLGLPGALPGLQMLDVSYNKLEELPDDLIDIKSSLIMSDIANLEVCNNPLSSIPSIYREDKRKLLFYARYGGKTEPWNQVKLMLVGPEGVGKTTFLRCLQGQQAPANKNINLSTNGVDITQVELPLSLHEGKLQKSSKKKEKVVCNVWDFGGQTVFHSTHRFFMTSSAIYVVVYNMADEQTHARLHHWMQQIASVVDNPGNSMPILIVGTHADKLTPQEQEIVSNKISTAYPLSRNSTGVQGHFAVSHSIRNDVGVLELKEAIIKIAREHPKLGIGNLQVPSFLMLIKEALEKLGRERHFLTWDEYKRVCQEIVITDVLPIVDWTYFLQDLGVLVWNNTVKLRDIVLINPQWLADALASVVTMVNQSSIARSGVAFRSRLHNVMKNKIADVRLYPVVFNLLERFEIILRMRNYYANVSVENDGDLFDKEEDTKYFVPSLLQSYEHKKDLSHPAMQFWKRLNEKKCCDMLKRRFTWSIFPANFFPRLLLRLMHMQMCLLGSWVDAGVVMSQDQGHHGFLHLFPKDGCYVLEVTVLQEKAVDTQNQHFHSREALISELAYTITRLDRDMWPDTPVQHDVVVCLPPIQKSESIKMDLAVSPDGKGGSPEERKFGAPPMLELVIPFADCVNVVVQNQPSISIVDHMLKLDFITPDLSCCTEIHQRSLSNLIEIGRGGFGVVYKGILNDPSISPNTALPVAIKEMQRDIYVDKDDQKEAVRKIYEFQHEMLIMSKVRHENLVQLYGMIKAPMSLVMEYVPCGDLHYLMLDQKKYDTMNHKWRLKLTIDIARGMNHLHKQTPPICHSDLRAPNIFIASLDPEANVVGKVADFGLAQQIFPFSSQILGNLTETAPETWGDEGNTKGTMYDERSDVFSYAILLWRLFGIPSPSTSSSPPSTTSSTTPSTTPSTSPRPPSSPSAEPLDVNDPYGHLKDPRGDALSKWTLRNKIREGERPRISDTCPEPIRALMEECWQSDPTSRPFFAIIVQRLHALYATEYGENDNYLAQATINVNEAASSPPINLKLQGVIQPNLDIKNWEPKPQIAQSGSSTWAVVSLLLLDNEIWAGTNTGALLIINAKTAKIESIIILQKSGRVTMLQAGRACIWASSETEKICMINAQTKYKIIEIDNEHPVTCMAISYHHAGPTNPVVWVADSKGYISLWDLTTVQKYCRLKVIDAMNPPVVRHMSVMREHMWMVAGTDVVIIETQTLQRVVKNTGQYRLNCIATVPSMKQAWTCSKDGWLRVWHLRETNSQGKTIELAKSVQHSTELKFVQSINSLVLPLARGHVVTGDFNGKLFLWNSNTIEHSEAFPMPFECTNHALQCALDAGELGLWLGTMNTTCPLQRYCSNPHLQPTKATPTTPKRVESYLLQGRP